MRGIETAARRTSGFPGVAAGRCPADAGVAHVVRQCGTEIDRAGAHRAVVAPQTIHRVQTEIGAEERLRRAEQQCREGRFDRGIDGSEEQFGEVDAQLRTNVSRILRSVDCAKCLGGVIVQLRSDAVVRDVFRHYEQL